MDLDDIWTRVKLLAVLFAVAGGFFYWQIHSARQAAVREFEEAQRRAEAPEPPKPLDPLTETYSSFQEAARKGDLAEGERLWKQLVAMPGWDHDHAAAWDLRGWASKEIAAGNLDAARRLVGLLTLRPIDRGDLRGLDVMREWKTVLLKKRSEAAAAGDRARAEALFIEAASVDPWDGSLRGALAGTPAAQLGADGSRLLEAGEYAAALAHFDAAAESQNIPPALQQKLPFLRWDCWWGLGLEAAAAGRVSASLYLSAILFLENVSGPRAREAATRMAGLLEQEADRAVSDSRFAAADSLLEQAQRKLPDGERSPDHARLAVKREALRLPWALHEVRSNTEEGLRMLRSALRRSADPADKALAASSIAVELAKALGAKDFGRIVDLSAFQLAELGAPSPGDPVRASLLAGLEAAAKELEGKSASRRVFILTLLADGFPDDPVGRQARDAAGVEGALFFQNATASPPGGKNLGSSGLPGLSVVSIENATGHYILAFYEGPERFFLRVNPYRRASAALKNGVYSVGVLASADEVHPYRSTVRYAGERLGHRFIIETRGPGAGQAPGSWTIPASGDWSLLRAPADSAPLEADPATGMVRRR